MIILVFYFVGSIVCVIFWTIASGGKQITVQPTTGELLGIDPMVTFVGMHFMFAALILGTWLVIRFLHRRSLLTLITVDKKIDFYKVFLGCAAWMVPFLVGHLVEWLVYPNSIKVTFEMPQFFYFVPVVLLLTPIQCLSEELVFRGYLLQSFSSWLRNPWVAATVNGFLFMLPHLMTPNLPEPFIVTSLCFFGIGFFYAIITIRTNSIEMAFGAHAGNNVMSALVINYEGSPLTTNSIFLSTEMRPWFELVSTVAAGVFMLVAARKLVVRQ